MTLDGVHEAMLAAIDSRYQKTAGFPAYDLTRAFALAVLSLDDDITAAEDRLNIETLTGIELDEFIRQHRGLTRKYATFAEATLQVVSGAGQIRAGDLFSTLSGVEFYATTDVYCAEGETFPVRATVGSTSGNVPAGRITYMPVTIAGIGAVTNAAAASGGYDTESDEELRERYYTDLQAPNNGSNQQAYIAWATAVPGVGRVKVFPLAQGANTVEVCITDTVMEPPTTSLVQAVQTVIDPNKNGDGSGTAPIGAVCTVSAATKLTVTVCASVTLESGYTLSAVLANVTAAITAYLHSIAFKQSYVSYAKIGNCLNDADGVEDYSTLTINGSTSNLTIEARQVPVAGTVTI